MMMWWRAKESYNSG